jgi:DNA polymerase/3'-5' exonuclease PolX
MSSPSTRKSTRVRKRKQPDHDNDNNTNNKSDNVQTPPQKRRRLSSSRSSRTKRINSNKPKQSRNLTQVRKKTPKKTSKKRATLTSSTSKRNERTSKIEGDKYVSRSGKVEPSHVKKQPLYDLNKIPSVNQAIADKFHELAELEKLNYNISRAAQARRVARSIESTNVRILNGEEASKNIARVGKKTIPLINEILQTGTLSRIEELKHRKKRTKDEGTNQVSKIKNNEELAKLFEELSMYEFDDQDRNRGAMFRLMANKIRQINEPIKSGEQIQGYHGFGPSAKEIVNEYLSKGKSTRLENLKKHLGTPQDNLKKLYQYEQKWIKQGKMSKH